MLEQKSFVILQHGSLLLFAKKVFIASEPLVFWPSLRQEEETLFSPT
jgi:hypothetical protein